MKQVTQINERKMTSEENQNEDKRKCTCCGSEVAMKNASSISINAWQIDHLLQRATKEVKEDYIKILRDGQMEHYRERAYCYELYHQMRCLWPEYGYSELLINGELDKLGHALYQETRISGAKPDFLVHRPGKKFFNHTIVEVKTSKSSAKDWCCDLDILDGFIQVANYCSAIFLLVGDNEQKKNMIDRLAEALKKYPKHQKEERTKKIEKLKKDNPEGVNPESDVPETVHPESWCREIQIWHHAKANEPAKKIANLGELLKRIGSSWST